MANYIIDDSRDGLLIIQDAVTIDRYIQLNYSTLEHAPSYAPNDDAYLRWKASYEHNLQLIREQCDPQEVYLYEYNNFECMYSDDRNALAMVSSIFGADVAKTIKRVHRYGVA